MYPEMTHDLIAYHNLCMYFAVAFSEGMDVNFVLSLKHFIPVSVFLHCSIRYSFSNTLEQISGRNSCGSFGCDESDVG